MGNVEKATYSFSCPSSLMVEGKELAKRYRVSFNMLLTLLLENAVQTEAVPGMAERNPDGTIKDPNNQEDGLAV